MLVAEACQCLCQVNRQISRLYFFLEHVPSNRILRYQESSSAVVSLQFPSETRLARAGISTNDDYIRPESACMLTFNAAVHDNVVPTSCPQICSASSLSKPNWAQKI